MFLLGRMRRQIDTTRPFGVILDYVTELGFLGLAVAHQRSSIHASGNVVDLEIILQDTGMTTNDTYVKLRTKLYINTPDVEKVGVLALEISPYTAESHDNTQSNDTQSNDPMTVDLMPVVFPKIKDTITTLPHLASIVAREFEVYKFNSEMSHPHRFPGSD